MNYDEFKEAREELRLDLRAHIARQSTDQTSRGCSVSGAYAIYRNMTGHTLRHVERYARFMWKEAYRQQRKRDRAHHKFLRTILSASMPDIVATLTNPRKIDQLLG